MRGEDEHLCGGDGLENLAGGFQAIQLWHRDVHQHHGGMEFFDQGDRLAAILSFADHLHIVFQFEHPAKPLAHNHVVFRQQNSD